MSRSLPYRMLSRLTPAPVKAAVRTVVRKAQLRSAARRGMIPPEWMWPMVGGAEGFVEGGRGLFDYLVERAGLKPTSTVLDIGCGIGKHAVHFAAYLVPPGRYEGFDVDASMIRWCEAAIRRRYPHLHFRHVPIQNAMYSPSERMQAADFSFPYAPASFDLVFLGSVFTHMFDRDVRHYMGEIARVLKPGGLCVATMYLLNDEKRDGIAAGTAVFTFAIPHMGSHIESPQPPEGAVAHEEVRALQMAADAGLTLAEPLNYGTWARTGEQSQDFMLLRLA